MTTVKLYKPNGREIEVNDKRDSIKVMLKDGWRLDPVEEPKANPAAPKKPTAPKKS